MGALAGRDTARPYEMGRSLAERRPECRIDPVMHHVQMLMMRWLPIGVLRRRRQGEPHPRQCEVAFGGGADRVEGRNMVRRYAGNLVARRPLDDIRGQRIVVNHIEPAGSDPLPSCRKSCALPSEQFRGAAPLGPRQHGLVGRGADRKKLRIVGPLRCKQGDIVPAGAQPVAQQPAMRFHTPHEGFTNGVADMCEYSDFQEISDPHRTLRTKRRGIGLFRGPAPCRQSPRRARDEPYEYSSSHAARFRKATFQN